MKKRKTNQLRVAVILASLLSTASVMAGSLCEGVAFMPTDMVITRAQDQPGMPNDQNSDQTIGLVDVHNYNHFYTFQVDRDVNERNEGLVMDLVTEHEKASTADGFAFRLRAEFNSAEASRSGMGFRVMLGYKVHDATGYVVEPLAEMTSLNTEEGEGTVSIDIPSLPAGRTYQLRYEFGQKEVLRNGDSLSMEEDSTATGDSTVNCNLPFFTQELMLVDRKVLKNRIRKYNQTPPGEELDISKHPICDFSLVNGEVQHGELGLQCNSKVFTYPLAGGSATYQQFDHGKDENGFTLKTLATYPFRVSGTDDEPITQLFKMSVGMEFAVGAGFRAVLRRLDGGVHSEYENLHPFACALDQSCQFAWRQQKNHQSFQVVLTTGDYELELFDLSQEEYTNWLVEDLELSQVPFTVYIESYPILQNEVRDHCPFMFLMDDFIQQKFIDGQAGQKFHFQDKVIMNLYNLKQEVLIVPELDSHLKVVIRESFGVNAMIQLCKRDNGHDDCFLTGQQIGTTEILYWQELEQDQEYVVVIDYSHSILAFHKFETCPHLPIEISMISSSEYELMNKNHYDEVLGLTDKSSRTKLKETFKKMSSVTKVTIDDPEKEGAYMLTSKSDTEFEVLYSQDIHVDLKMGLFMEIFYSPFDDEVLELYLGERYDLLHEKKVQADREDDYDNDDKENKKVFTLNKYKSAKTIWVDLEPGEYTLQILMMRQPSKESKSYYEKVNFQLYAKYDFVNVPREAFVPGSLNYHGLLGVGDETHDFGHVTMFWDDLTLWHPTLSTVFQVQSEMASIAIQLEQLTDLVKVHLATLEAGEWKLVGTAYPEVSEAGRIDTVEEFGLVPNQQYKITLFKDSFSEHAQIEQVEMGERYGLEFSLKIDVSEFDDEHLADNLQKAFREFLPVNLEQVAKEKRSVLGMNEKSFMMGNRNMIHLIEYGDGWQDLEIIPSYVPKEKRVFISKQTDQSIVSSLPFEVNGIAEMIYAGIYEYTSGANLMSLHIIDDETHEEVAMSKQGKYLSLISGVFLPEGNYYLVIKNDRAVGQGAGRQAPLEFVLDVVRHQVPEGTDFLVHQLEALQLCQLPQLPSQGLSKPGFMHPLSGGATQAILKPGIVELDSGSATSFTLVEDSLVTVYVEAPEDIPVALQIQETGGVRKALALSTDQDRTQSNFLHQEGFKGRNVVQLREFLAKGTYWINAKAINEDVLLNFDQREGFCDTFTMVVTVNQLKVATQTFNPDTDEEFCEDMDPLVNTLRTDGMVRGNLVKELTKYSAEVGYFDFDATDQEGPFLVYFQLDYDVSQEGVVAVALSQYDKDFSSFTEIGLYTVADSQTTVLQIVERGTYAISIQSIVSTPAKFQQLGFGKKKLSTTPLLTSHCFRGVYTYMVASVNDHDGSMAGLAAFTGANKANRVRVMESIDDLRNLREFQTCRHNELPEHFPISDEGFERQYAFRMSSGGYQVIGLIVEEPSLIRVVLNMRNPKNQVHAHLLGPGSIDSSVPPIAKSDAVHNSLLTAVTPNEAPYLVELIHSEFDSSDPCPVYDFHIAVKPLRYVPEENLACVGAELPPEEIVVEEKTMKLDLNCAFTDEMISATGEDGILEYDIIVDLPHSDYFFDVEMKTDFLTGNFRLYAFAFDHESETWHKIAASRWVDENSYEDVGLDADQPMSTKLGDKTMIQKLRFLEDADPKVMDQADKIMIRIKVNTHMIVKELQDYELYDPRDSLCFNFDFNLFVDEINQAHISDNAENKLIRVDWHGKEQAAGHFDTTGRVNAFIQFEKSLAHQIPALKASFQESIYLQPLLASGKPDMNGLHVVPTHFKSKFNADDTLVLGFAPHTLEKGVCYILKFAPAWGFGGVSLAPMLKPEYADSLDLHVCASGCDCDVTGTEDCVFLEETGDHVCLCHPHFLGVDCSECEEGYYRNGDGYCEMAHTCAELGGNEDCNDHGTCYQEGPTAVCQCDPGFTNNGLDQCGRCSDPLMTYPNMCAKQRNWIMEQEDYECETLMHVMPHKLFKDPRGKKQGGGLENKSQVIYQQRSGMLEWAGRYALVQPSLGAFASTLAFLRKDNAAGTDPKFRRESEHSFFLRQTSMFRLHLGTLESGAKVRWQILNGEQEVVSSDETFYGSTTAFGTLTQLDHPDDAFEKPWSLQLQYEHEHEKHDFTEPPCPKLEIHFVVEPSRFHTESLECDATELDIAKSQEFERSFTFDNQDHVSEQTLVLPSYWLTEQAKHKESLLTKSDKKEKMATIDLDITLKRAGVFSLIAATDFSNLNVFLSLVDKADEELVAIEKSFMLDDVEVNADRLGETSDMSVAKNRDAWDHLSAVEVAHLPAGHYKLSIAIPKGHWFVQKALPTCLSLDLMIEFVQKDISRGEDEFGDNSGPVQILTVFPPSKQDLKLGGKLNMMINLEREVDFREAAAQLPDLARLCRLQNKVDKQKYINPARYWYDKDLVKLTFDFAKEGDFVNQVYKDNGERASAGCWQLRCKDQPTGDDDMYFQMAASADSHSYCFAGLGKDASVFQAKAAQCNPFAKAKPLSDGSCQCTPPYSGKLCEACESGFRGEAVESSWDDHLGGKHTICVADDESDAMDCNGFGVYDRRRRACACEPGYGGDFCEHCEDASFEYPDCTGEMDAEYMESLAFEAFNQRRREQVYHQEYHLENVGSPFQQECQYTDFPNFLNQIQNHKEFLTGDFHIADVFTVNHDTDNVIEFTPRTKGLFKIMLKQPELEVATAADEAMHIELGIVRADGTGAMTAETNHAMSFSPDGGSKALTDFGVLEFEVTSALVDEPLLVYFRGVNQTHDAGFMEDQLCAQLFIELEFRATANLHKCESQHPELSSQKKPIELGQDQTYPAQEQVQTLFVADNSDAVPFFYAQDFYIKNDESMAEFDVEVQVAQKFIDQHLIVPVVEILELDIEVEDFDLRDHKIGAAPQCKLECLVAGHKLYNAFTIMTTVPRGSMIRIWLYQNASLNPVKLLGKQNTETCVNYALSVRTYSEMSKEHEESLKDNLYCEHTRYLPRNLNRLRYLGTEDGKKDQQDFNYIEHFRVDNLKHEGRETKFTLKERTVVRIDGIEHDSLQFFIKIYKGKQVMAGQDIAQLDGTETMLFPSIFTVLEPGEYSFKVEFIAREAEILRQACQSIQIQIAMNRANEDQLYPREQPRDVNVVPITLENISSAEEHFFEAKVNPVADNDKGKFTVLFDESMIFEDRDDLNLAMKISSDFLRSDVNFVLIHVESDHHFMPQHIFEDSKKMSLPEMTPGVYRLIIFMQNVEMTRNTIFQPVLFSFNFRLFSFIERDTTYVSEMTKDYEVGEQHMLRMPFSTPEKLECYTAGRRLPENLTQNVLLHETDFEFTFSIFGEDLAFVNDHIIKYQPEQGEDILRILTNEDVRIKVYEYKAFMNDMETTKPIAVSHSKLGSNFHELVVKDLSSNTAYAIQVVLAEDPEDYEMKQDIGCLMATLQVKIANSDTEYVCLTKGISEIQTQLDGQNNSLKLSYATLSDKGKHLNMVSSKTGIKKLGKLKPTDAEIEIVDENTDLEITVEGSDHLYGSVMYLTPKDHDDITKDNDGDERGMSMLLGKVLGNRHVIQPVHISSPKHMTKFRYINLTPGKYQVKLKQPAKPSDCDNVVDVLFQVSQSLESRLKEKFSSGKSRQIRYQSKQEVSQHGVFALPSVLPMQLDNYRFFKGGNTEEKYMLFSDTFSLHDEEEKNTFNFGKVAGNDTYVRIYAEDDALTLNLTCWNAETKKLEKQKKTTNGFIEEYLQENCECSIGLVHTNKQEFSKRIFLEEKVRITVMVADYYFVKQKYREFHREGLAACPQNQWPLALAKNTELNVDSDEQSYYNYPLIRYPHGTQNYFMNPSDMNSYYFRFNETQRFYFEVGSHFVMNHAVLKLSPTSRAFGAYELLGKQIGNINVIDQDVPPGDYKLDIQTFKNAEIECGLYSLRGLLNMHAAMTQHLPGRSMIKGSSMCELKNTEEAPSQIYAKSANTRKGNEAVIDDEGNFFRYYKDLLIVKQHNEVLEPWTHEISLDIPDTSFLQIILGSEHVPDMVIKVFKTNGGSNVRAALKTETETNSEIMERKSLWKLERGAYMIEIEYAGDMYNEFGEEKHCAYFDLMLAINSMKSLGKKLSCDAQPVIADAESLLTALPREIGSADMDWKMNGLYTLKYPKDFKKIKYASNGKQSMAMILPTIIDLKDPFTFSASMAFDVHMADFSLQLNQIDQAEVDSATDEDGLPNYDVIERSSRLINLEDNDDETFIREVPQVYVSPGDDSMAEGKYLLTIEEKQAFLVFNEVAKAEGAENLCLPFIFKMKVTEGHSASGLAGLFGRFASHAHGATGPAPGVFDKAEIIDFTFGIADARGHEAVVPFSVPRVSVNVLATDAAKDDDWMRKKAFMLVFKVNDAPIQKFKPANIEISERHLHGQDLHAFTIDFKIDLERLRSRIKGADSMSLDFEIDPAHLKSAVDDSAFEIHETVVDKLQSETIMVQFPLDLQAKFEVEKKEKGTEIKDTLANAMALMHDMKDQGTGYPPEIVKMLKKIQEKDMDDLKPEDIYKMSSTIESIMKHNDFKPKKKAQVSETKLLGKCTCVHGKCEEGTTQCAQCDKGWTGRMCDQKVKDKKSKPDVKKIFDDEDEEEIVTKGKSQLGKKVSNSKEDHEAAVAGRRGKAKAARDKVTDFVPRKAYSDKAGISDKNDDEEEIINSSKSKKPFNNHVTKASDIDDSESSSSGGTGKSWSKADAYNKQNTTTDKKNQPEEQLGFFAWIFWSIVNMIEYLIYAAIAIVCLVLLKSGCESLNERVQSAQQKKKKGKRKRQSEENDGMGLTEEGIKFSDDENDDSDNSPIEMTLVKRTKKEKKSKGKRSERSEDSSETGSQDNLQLYDQDDEEGGVKADYNPFDQEVAEPQQTDLLQLDTEVEGQAMLNEIDDALDGDSDDNDEFGTFV